MLTCRGNLQVPYIPPISFCWDGAVTFALELFDELPICCEKYDVSVHHYRLVLIFPPKYSDILTLQSSPLTTRYGFLMFLFDLVNVNQISGRLWGHIFLIHLKQKVWTFLYSKYFIANSLHSCRLVNIIIFYVRALVLIEKYTGDAYRSFCSFSLSSVLILDICYISLYFFHALK